MQSEVYFMSFHHDGYLHKHSPGLGFCIRILTLLAWSNSGLPVANNLVIIRQTCLVMQAITETLK